MSVSFPPAGCRFFTLYDNTLVVYFVSGISVLIAFTHTFRLLAGWGFRKKNIPDPGLCLAHCSTPIIHRNDNNNLVGVIILWITTAWYLNQVV